MHEQPIRPTRLPTGRRPGRPGTTLRASLRVCLAAGLFCTLFGGMNGACSRPPAAPLTATPRPAAPALASVRAWVYQLQDYQDDRLDQIAANDFDLAVIDLARDAGADYFGAAEIAALRASGKIVLAYFSIASIEDYRPELPLVPPDIILGAVEGWPEERYVKYWDERWWPIVQGRLDQAQRSGFDGAYLDLIFAYEDIPANSAGSNRKDLAGRMVDLIARISEYAKAQTPAFQIVPQNNPELHTFPKYLPAIDGLAVENMYYLDTGEPCTADWCQENIDTAQAVLRAGKPVFSVDYATAPDDIRDAYSRARAAGFVPYVSQRGLPACYLSGVAPLTPCRDGRGP